MAVVLNSLIIRSLLNWCQGRLIDLSRDNRNLLCLYSQLGIDCEGKILKDCDRFVFEDLHDILRQSNLLHLKIRIFKERLCRYQDELC